MKTIVPDKESQKDRAARFQAWLQDMDRFSSPTPVFIVKLQQQSKSKRLAV
jgi:hypothetical protein